MNVFKLNNKGVVLIVTVIAALFVATLGLILASWRHYEGVDATNIMREAQALSIAESGVRETIYHLTAIDPAWLGDSPENHPMIVNGVTVGVYRVVVVDLGDNKRELQIIGYVPDATSPQSTKTLHVQGTLTGSSSAGINEIFLYGIYNGGGSGEAFTVDKNYSALPLQNNTLPKASNKQVRGAIFSNTGFVFKNGDTTVIDGDVVIKEDSTITVTNWSGPYTTGDIITDAEELITPVFNATAKAAYIANAEVVYSGATSLTGHIDLGDHITDDGDIFVDGDLAIDAVIKGLGYIVASGNIIISGSITGLSAGALVNLISFKNITYSNPANVVVQAGMYAGDKFQILTTGKFDMSRGSIAATNGFVINPLSTTTISWDPKLGDPTQNPNALGFALGVGAAGLGGGSLFTLSGGGTWHEVD